jgi:hypothetical protein
VIRIFDESFNTIQQSQAGEIAACIVRTAGHDFMDLRVNINGKLEGGSDGCMDFSDPSNNGVANCLINFGYLKAYNEVCDKVSVADFIVIAAEAIMGRTAEDYDPDNKFAEGSLLESFKNNFYYGRVTNLSCEKSFGKMPDAQAGCKGPKSVEDVFVQNIFGKLPLDIAWKLSAALMGVHSLGGAHRQNSGSVGLWGTSEESEVFTNDYYQAILYLGWAPDYVTLPDGSIR